ncbi:MAG: Mrp/NBP35 family ATP-binding protein [Planctomycetes bacterium]|nr:Mrp/NBP35 family ATP-binding protein [Planctomycetota bacterium]
MSDLAAQVTDALRSVQDPDLHKDLVTLNMIRGVEVRDAVARFALVLTTGACPVKQQLEDQCRAAALSVPGVTRAEITVSAEVPKGASMSDILPGVRHIIGIGSGKGGVGKSTVTVNLACSLATRGARVGLLDADIYGPSIPTMMGINQQPFVVNKRLVPVESHGVKLISMGFLLDERQPVVWRGPMIVGALKQFITDVDWGELDYLLVDLPPGTGDIQLTLAQTVPLAGAVIVSTPQAVALLDARRSAAMFTKVNVPIFGIVENMSEYICPSCGHADAIFGSGGGEREATALAVPFLGRIPLEPAVRAAGDDGTPIVIRAPKSRSAHAFTEVAERVAQRASILALQKTKT